MRTLGHELDLDGNGNERIPVRDTVIMPSGAVFDRVVGERILEAAIAKNDRTIIVKNDRTIQALERLIAEEEDGREEFIAILEKAGYGDMLRKAGVLK